MKKILLVVFTVFLFGCDLMMNNIIEDLNSDTPIYYGDFSKLTSNKPFDICVFIKYSLGVKKGPDIIEEYYTPEETVQRGIADCEDFSRLFLNILFVQYGVKGNLIYINGNRQIINGGYVNHVIVEINNELYCPYSGKHFGSFTELKPYLGFRVFFNDIFILD